jgi:hypothetical protein
MLRTLRSALLCYSCVALPLVATVSNISNSKLPTILLNDVLHKNELQNKKFAAANEEMDKMMRWDGIDEGKNEDDEKSTSGSCLTTLSMILQNSKGAISNFSKM